MSWTTTTGTTVTFVGFEPYVAVKYVAHVDMEHGVVHLFSNSEGNGVVHIASSSFTSLCDRYAGFLFVPCGVEHRRKTIKKMLCRHCIDRYQRDGGRDAWPWLHDWIMTEAPR
jgi:hypothetical protein